MKNNHLLFDSTATSPGPPYLWHLALAALTGWFRWMPSSSGEICSLTIGVRVQQHSSLKKTPTFLTKSSLHLFWISLSKKSSPTCSNRDMSKVIHMSLLLTAMGRYEQFRWQARGSSQLHGDYECVGFCAAAKATEMPAVEREVRSRASDQSGSYELKHLRQRMQAWLAVLRQSLTM